MELQEALGGALGLEYKVRDHYAQCARQTKDPHGKKVFATMAREEQGHVDYLESRLAEWKATGAVQEQELPTLLPTPAWLEGVAAKIAASAQVPSGSPGNPKLPELEFLKEALALERSASAFYQSLVAYMEPEHRPLFARFLDIEDGHVILVQAEIDALVGHGHWFDFMEFNLENA